MRTDPVPCINATQYEIDQGKHLTWNDDSHCQPCQRILDRFIALHQQSEVDSAESDEAYAMWNTGTCAKCNGSGILGPETDAHPSVYGMECPDCTGDYNESI
jgi:excinuclease UvrABC ATPase subunit